MVSWTLVAPAPAMRASLVCLVALLAFTRLAPALAQIPQTLVGSVNKLRRSIQSSAEHIELQEHLDLRFETAPQLADGGVNYLLAVTSTTKSLRVRWAPSARRRRLQHGLRCRRLACPPNPAGSAIHTL